MARRDVHIFLGLLAATVCLVVVQGVTGAEVMMLSPALALALPLLAGRYVGEQRVARLAARLGAPVRRAVRTLRASLPRAPRALRPRGAGLLACSLAERGPPAAAAAR